MDAEGVLFAHQSIGDGMLSALKGMDGGSALTFLTATGDTAAPDPGPGKFVSFWLETDERGLNGDPEGKFRMFDETMRMSSVGSVATMAQVKTCYTDWDDPGNDTVAHADARWAQYESMMAELRVLYPDIRFIHWTVPVVQSSRDSLNWLREYFSDKIRATYPAADVFDVARVQSEDASGANPCLETEGPRSNVRCMHPAWGIGARDTGHPNAAGYAKMAEAWLNVMACP